MSSSLPRKRATSGRTSSAGRRRHRARARSRRRRARDGRRRRVARPGRAGRDRAGPPVRLRPVRDAQPLRARHRARPRRPDRGARRLQRPRAAHRRRPDRGRRLPQQRQPRPLRDARPPARAPPQAERRIRAAARPAADPHEPRAARTDDRRRAGRGERRARLEQRLQARAPVDRRAGAPRRGKAAPLPRDRLAVLRVGGARLHVADDRRGAAPASRRQSTASPPSSRRRSSSRSSRSRYASCCRPRQAEITSGMCGNATSSHGISSGRKKANSRTSSSGVGTPSAIRALQ